MNEKEFKRLEFAIYMSSLYNVSLSVVIMALVIRTAEPMGALALGIVGCLSMLYCIFKKRPE